MDQTTTSIAMMAASGLKNDAVRDTLLCHGLQSYILFFSSPRPLKPEALSISRKGQILKRPWETSSNPRPGSQQAPTTQHLQPLDCGRGAKALGEGNPLWLAENSQSAHRLFTPGSSEPREPWTIVQHHEANRTHTHSHIQKITRHTPGLRDIYLHYVLIDG